MLILVGLLDGLLDIEIPTNIRIGITIIGVLSLVAALFMRIPKGVTLLKTTQETTWQQESIGKRRRWRLATSKKVSGLLPNPPQESLQYPASVSALALNLPAAEVVRAALLGLLWQGALELRQATVSGNLDATKQLYHKPPPFANNPYLIASVKVNHHIVKGALEDRILKTLDRWSVSSLEGDGLFIGTLPLIWPLQPTEYILVREVIERLRDDPGSWLLDLVREDAVARGIFTENDGNKDSAAGNETGSISDQQIIEEGRAIQDWWEGLAQHHPEFADALNRGIQSAINSKRDSG